jgi:nicotinate phosphoribosyltransferase
MDAVITSLLENDLYKFTMQQLIMRTFPKVLVNYEFINRGNTKFPKGFAHKVREQVKLIGNLSFKKDEIDFFRTSCPFLKNTYLEWLFQFRPNPNHVKISQIDGNLKISIKGPWYQTIYWEVPLMAIISELYFTEMGYTANENWEKLASEKGNLLKFEGCNFADFGLRRRFSSVIQDKLVQIMTNYSKEPGIEGGFVGTSNVYLAYKYGLKPIGTMAHELTMVLAVLYGFQSANEILLDLWTREFGGELGIALPDTFTTEVFLRSFNRRYAMLFDGLRQDSGDPEQFVDKVCAHYSTQSIDPTSKTIVFSDGLNEKKAVKLKMYCEGKIKCSFGIGTNLTNNVGVQPLNIVIKVTSAKKPDWPWTPAIKLSDTKGKITGDIETANMAIKLLGVE